MLDSMKILLDIVENHMFFSSKVEEKCSNFVFCKLTPCKWLPFQKKKNSM